MRKRVRFSGPKAGDMTRETARLVQRAERCDTLSAVVGVPSEAQGPAEIQIFLDLGCRCGKGEHSFAIAACFPPDKAKLLAEGILASLGSARFKAAE